MCRDWSAIPTIPDIASRLPSDADYLHFRAVCSSWRSNTPNRPTPSLLLIVELDSRSLGICNFPDPQISPSKLRDDILRKKFLCGTSRGWIAVLDRTPAISLHNPVTGDHCKLPILHFDNESVTGLRVTKVGKSFNYCKAGETNYTFLQSFSEVYSLLAMKVVLSSDPSDEDCVVMALRYEGEKLIYCRPREGDSWNILDVPCAPLRRVQDIIFYNGQFYGVFEYRVFVCNIGPGEPEVIEILPATPLFSDGGTRTDYFPMLKSYLVVSSQGLLLVAVTKPSKRYKIRDYICEVFRVDLVDGMLSLVKLESLGGRSLFLGRESMSLCAAIAPGCTPNCIYYSHCTDRPRDDEIEWVDIISIFNMEDGSTSCITSLSNVYSGVHWITSRLS